MTETYRFSEAIMKLFIGGKFLNWNEYINLERANKYAANEVKKEEKARVTLFAKKKYSGDYPIEIIARPHFKDHRKDLDNTRLKGIIDGLVACGVIKNDNLNCVQRLVIEPIFSKIEGVEIEINDVNTQR